MFLIFTLFMTGELKIYGGRYPNSTGNIIKYMNFFIKTEWEYINKDYANHMVMTKEVVWTNLEH